MKEYFLPLQILPRSGFQVWLQNFESRICNSWPLTQSRRMSCIWRLGFYVFNSWLLICLPKKLFGNYCNYLFICLYCAISVPDSLTELTNGVTTDPCLQCKSSQEEPQGVEGKGRKGNRARILRNYMFSSCASVASAWHYDFLGKGDIISHILG